MMDFKSWCGQTTYLIKLPHPMIPKNDYQYGLTDYHRIPRDF